MKLLIFISILFLASLFPLIYGQVRFEEIRYKECNKYGLGVEWCYWKYYPLSWIIQKGEK